MELCYANNQKSLFRKYHRLITNLTEHQTFRDYVMDKAFPMPQEKLALLLPNGYIRHGIHNEYQLVVSSRPVYARKLYPALRIIDYFARQYTSYDELVRAFFYEITELQLFRNPLGYKYQDARLRFLTTTFNPNASPETTSVDGRVSRAGQTEAFTTLTAGAGTVGGSTDASNTSTQIFSSGTANNWEAIVRGIFLFDTSALGSNAILTVGSNTFSIYGSSKSDNYSQTIQLTTSNPAANTAIVAADYARANFGTTLRATGITITAWNNSGYNDFTLNTDGESLISKTGISKFGTRCSSDVNDSAPVWASATSGSILTLFADNGSNKPKLVVNYTVAGGAFLFNML